MTCISKSGPRPRTTWGHPWVPRTSGPPGLPGFPGDRSKKKDFPWLSWTSLKSPPDSSGKRVCCVKRLTVPDSAASTPALQHPDAPASTGQSWTAASRGPNFALFGSSKIVWYNCYSRQRLPALACAGQRWKRWEISAPLWSTQTLNTRFPDVILRLSWG